MPLTDKGREIIAAMKEQYGAEKGERVFYASKNAGKISGVDSADSATIKASCGDELAHKLGMRDDEWSEAAREKAALARQRGPRGKGMTGTKAPKEWWKQKEKAMAPAKGDDGLVSTGPAEPSSAKADKGPGHDKAYVGKENMYHLPVENDASPLARAEAKYDEDRLLEKISSHCDAISKRLDDCEDDLVRNGKRDRA